MNVYDFDNTIYDGESCYDLFRFYLKKDPALLKFMPVVVKGFARYKKGYISLNEMIEKYVPIAEQKLKEIDFENDPKAFWDKHMHKIKPFYKQQQQEEDLLITASPYFHMKEICCRLGIHNYLTTKVNQQSGKIEFACIRENKITAFREQYAKADIENFYTDSPENDAPLIELAKHAFVVKGNQITQVK